MRWALRVALALAAVSIGAQQPRATAILPGFRSPVWLDTTGQARVLGAPRDRVLAAVDTALQSLGIPLDVRMPSAGLVGTGRLKTQRRLGGERISRWLDCGVGVRGATADVYQVSLALLGMVRQVHADSVELRVALAAGAQDFSGPLGDPISCSSTGALEERVFAAVAARLKAP